MPILTQTRLDALHSALRAVQTFEDCWITLRSITRQLWWSCSFDDHCWLAGEFRLPPSHLLGKGSILMYIVNDALNVKIKQFQNLTLDKVFKTHEKKFSVVFVVTRE